MGVLAQPTYPSMERQDLTQGQLGSFKFTPVDIIDPSSLQTSHLGDTPLLWQAQARLRERMEQQDHLEGISWTKGTSDYLPYPRKHKHRAQQSSFNSVFSQSSGGPQSLKSTPDSAFFNRNIKPDLEESRLKLGPAAFQSAVDGSSPERSNSHYKANQAFNPHHTLSSQAHFLQSIMNPEAGNFDPKLSASDDSQDEAALFNAGLCRALLAEQQSHKETRRNLDNLLIKLQDTQAQLDRVIGENKSLIASVKMLGSIIKHNESRLQARGQDSRSDNNKMDGGGGVEGKQNGTASGTGEALPVNGHCDETHEDQHLNFTTVSEQAPIDQSKLFNLDLLKQQDSCNSRTSRLSRTLRKHFSVDDLSSDGSESVKIVVDKSRNPDELVRVSPDETPKAKGPSAKEQEYSPSKTTFRPEQNNGGTIEVNNLPKYGIDNLQSADNAVLELPASFLNKYTASRKDIKSEDSDEEDSAAEAVVRSGRNEQATTSRFEPSSATTGTMKLLEPTTVNVAPYDLSIKWNITKENPIYEEDEKMRAMAGQMGPIGAIRQQVFWKHPVRYIEHQDKNIFRTVMIDAIPNEATYSDVLNEICAGSLERISLVPSVGKADRYKTARVVFNFELGASLTANYARDHGMKIKGEPVRVWQVITQTYPKNTQLDMDVFDNGFTRVLLINKASKTALDSIPTKLARFNDQIVTSGETFDKYPMIEFTSVAAAVEAMRILISDTKFASAEFDFDEDPCGKFGHDAIAINDM